MAHSPSYFLIGLASVLTFVHNCLCGGTIQVTLIEYEPRKWKQKNDEECRQTVCGIFFQVKFYEEGLDGRWLSDVWPMVTSQVFQLRNDYGILFFGKRLSDTQPNPMRRNFTSGVFGLRIFVVETGAQRPLEEFNSIFSITEFPPTQERDHTFYSEKYPFSIFTMRILFLCHKFYFGPKCAIHCEPQDDDRLGHYNCTKTGEKFCLQGWRNVSGNCVARDFCGASPCQNNATCSQTLRNFTCACPEGFAGRLCETKLTACDMHDPCRNGGTCLNAGPNSTRCACPDGWTGPHCAEDRDECLEVPCRNEGHCRNLPDGLGFECDCKGTEFEGSRCEYKEKCLDGKWPCLNNGTCEKYAGGFRCVCPSPFIGKDCSRCNASHGSCILLQPNETGRPHWSQPGPPTNSFDLLFWIAIAAVCGIVSGGFFGPTAVYILQRRKGWLRLSSSRKLYTPDLDTGPPGEAPNDESRERFLPDVEAVAANEPPTAATHMCGFAEVDEKDGAVEALETNC